MTDTPPARLDLDAARPWAPVAAALLSMGGVALMQPAAAPWLALAALLTVLAALAFRPRRSGPAPSPVQAGEDEARAAAALAAETLEALPDPLVVVAARDAEDVGDRTIIRANDAASRLLRLPGGVLEHPLHAVIRDPGLLEAVDEALFGGRSQSIDYQTGGVQARTWSAWVAPLPGDDADVRRAILRLRDETDARRAEMMRVDFLANASHELRTPLASLSGFIETLRGHARDDPAARDKFLAIMAVQAERMTRLVADLLSLSRIELNEHIPPSGKVDLAGAVSDVVDATAPLAARRGVRLVVTRQGEGSADVAGDRDQLIQVIQNLIDNAIKYSPDAGTVEISLTTPVSADEAVRVRQDGAAGLSLLTPDRDADVRYGHILVRDRGPGLARETMPRLTERFYRVEGQKSGERLGTGLGLAIVKHIVNRHRGGMTVESTVGQGAAFGVYLPLHRPAGP